MADLEKIEAIQDVVLVRPQVFPDPRGRFMETYRRSWFPLGREMIQGSRSDKQAGSLVGLHYHLHQADYWYVPSGRARVVLHDLRVASPTDGNTYSVEIGDENEVGLFIPPGVAHGFCAISDMTLTYLVDGYYNPSDELGVFYLDPAIKADWGVADPVVSDRDKTNPKRDEIPDQLRPRLGLRR